MSNASGMPYGWRMEKLGNLLTKIVGGGTPSREKESFWNGGIPWATVKDLKKSILHSTEESITLEALKESASNLIPKNTLIIATRMALGKVVFFSKDVAINQDLKALFTTEELKRQFLFHWLQYQAKAIERLGSGSTVKGIRLEVLKGLDLALPPLAEQQKIAEILSIMDEKVELIDEQLAKTVELKTGLMQRLLTKGIGHSTFKDSPLGEIPESWEASLLDEVTNRGSGHTPSRSFPEYYGGGIKWISLADSNRLDKGWIKESKYNISNLGIKNSSAVLHPKGTVLLSRDAGVGKSAVMHEEMAVSQHFITWTCGPKINNWFLYYYLQTQKPYFERVAAGSTIKTIGLPLFKKFLVPLPPMNEQCQIAELLTTVDEKNQVLHDKKEHYQTLKRGLMQQLLTGKLRVRLTEDAVPA